MRKAVCRSADEVIQPRSIVIGHSKTVAGLSNWGGGNVDVSNHDDAGGDCAWAAVRLLEN